MVDIIIKFEYKIAGSSNEVSNITNLKIDSDDVNYVNSVLCKTLECLNNLGLKLSKPAIYRLCSEAASGILKAKDLKPMSRHKSVANGVTNFGYINISIMLT